MERTKKRYRHVSNALLLTLIGLLYLTTSYPGARSVMGGLYPGPVYRGNGEDKVSLQCVVEWDAAALPSMLDTLKEQGTAITFCVSGAWAKENPDLLRRMAEDGHELAVTGMQPRSDGDAAWVAEDVTLAQHAVQELTGSTPVIYYSGSRDVAVSGTAARELELTQVLCTVDLLCARGGALDILNRALDGAYDGSIMLMQPTGAAAAALPAILERMAELQKEVVPTGRLLGPEGI